MVRFSILLGMFLLLASAIYVTVIDRSLLPPPVAAIVPAWLPHAGDITALKPPATATAHAAPSAPRSTPAAPESPEPGTEPLAQYTPEDEKGLDDLVQRVAGQ